MTIDVLHVLPDLKVGGGQQVVLDAVRSGDRTRFRYHIAHIFPDDEMGHRFRDLGIDTVCVAGRSPVSTVRQLVRLIGNLSVDLLHVHSPVDRKYGHSAALLTRKPVVSHLHSPWDHRGTRIPAGSGLAKSAVKRLKAAGRDSAERRVVARYIAVSEAVLEFFEARGLDRITLIENGVDLGRFAPTDTGRSEARQRVGTDRRVVMSVARLDVGKGHLDLVRATTLTMHEDWDLVLVGDGPLTSEISEFAAQLGVTDRVRLLGSRGDVPELLPAADVWALASESEGLPISVIEAMAAARPIVCYDLPTLRQMLADDSGMLVDHDPRSLAAAFDALFDNPDLAARLGTAACSRAAERYDAKTMARSIEAVYNSVISG